jgi:hypothetical protein
VAIQACNAGPITRPYDGKLTAPAAAGSSFERQFEVYKAGTRGCESGWMTCNRRDG